jgi:hypothetical protein
MKDAAVELGGTPPEKHETGEAPIRIHDTKSAAKTAIVSFLLV